MIPPPPAAGTGRHASARPTRSHPPTAGRHRDHRGGGPPCVRARAGSSVRGRMAFRVGRDPSNWRRDHMSFEGILLGLIALAVGAAFTFYGFKFFLILLPLWA